MTQRIVKNPKRTGIAKRNAFQKAIENLPRYYDEWSQARPNYPVMLGDVFSSHNSFLPVAIIGDYWEYDY